MRRWTALVALLLVAVGPAARAQKQPEKLPDVVISGDPVAPSPGQSGTGLCTTTRVSNDPDKDFPVGISAFVFAANNFLDASPDTANPNARVSAVLRTLFDQSNNLADGRKRSFGDFEKAVGGCGVGGCNFSVRDDTYTSFGFRLRGYLNVTSDLLGLPVHFGFYADDAVVFTLYDRQFRAYTVINRPPKTGASTWRTTNKVTFLKAGLYPVEIIHAQYVEDAALEMSMFVGDFTDYERGAEQTPNIKLSTVGFTLLAPASFYQTESGRPSYPNLAACQQCNRQYANTAGNADCGPSYYCNGAALCAPCDSAVFCGSSCSPCGGSTPLCINRNGNFICGQCTDDAQCPNGRCDKTTNTCGGCNTDAQCPNGQHCDTEQHECRECVKDSNCARGQSCINNTCQACSAKDSCAGTSCNCCPGDLQCATTSPGTPPTCVECTNDTQCTDGKRCDVANGRCVEKVSECNTSERCGAQCAQCPSDRPYCMDGQVCVACRSDLECGAGQFCLSGQCASCTTDKRCGTRCGACPAQTPVCLTDGTAVGSSCVGCTENAHCGPGGTCNPVTRTCSTPACSVSCADGRHCSGDACVECFTDAHCPCGGTCDTATNTCTVSCNSSNDCLGVEYCSPVTLQCERGRRKPNTETQGGPPCCGATGEAAPSFLALLLLASLLPRRRSRSAS